MFVDGDLFDGDDEFGHGELTEFCTTPGCVEVGMHYCPGECMTARDAYYYYADAVDEPVPWAFREPFYGLGLLWRYLRYRDDVHRREWEFYWACDRPMFLRLGWLPRRCFECGRWRCSCPDGGLPF